LSLSQSYTTGHTAILQQKSKNGKILQRSTLAREEEMAGADLRI
jgi:hypothetical protein